ncbi:MAG: hypothetical protein AVDCRST_MAG07-2479, partial [uncultured Frankineae bacterium]
WPDRGQVQPTRGCGIQSRLQGHRPGRQALQAHGRVVVPVDSSASCPRAPRPRVRGARESAPVRSQRCESPERRNASSTAPSDTTVLSQGGD